MTLRTLNYGNYGIFLIMGHAGFCPSAVRVLFFLLLGFNMGTQIGKGGGKKCFEKVPLWDLKLPQAPPRFPRAQLGYRRIWGEDVGTFRV